jgi:hypothetical protein
MSILKKLRLAGLALVFAAALTGCEPNVYGSVGVSSSSWGGWGGSGMHGSLRVGGRIL